MIENYKEIKSVYGPWILKTFNFSFNLTFDKYLHVFRYMMLKSFEINISLLHIYPIICDTTTVVNMGD